MTFNLDDLAAQVLKRRGERSIRAAAHEIEIGHATLSRIENGHIPDLETFAKICRWLEVDPGHFLGIEKTDEKSTRASVHLRAKGTPDIDTASALGELIIYGRKALVAANHT